MRTVSWFPRTTDSSNSWFARAEVYQDFLSRYDVDLSGTWGTLEINATISLVVDADFQSVYTILSSVELDFPVFYDLAGGEQTTVYRDFVSVYAITDELASFEVEQDFPAFWQSAGVVTADFSPVWTIDVPDTSADWAPVDPETSAWTPVPLPSSSWTQQVTAPTGWN